jgi:NAD(P)-dependent dehydrogenase (short-subunit alcohol dehydrogenase family)
LCEGLAQEAKLFNVRVVIIEPGIINTDMAQHIGTEPSPSVYPQSLRMAALFAISLQQPTPPEIVAQKILEIIESDSCQLRYTVGPDAEGYINSRASMSDEQWVERGAVDDDTWYADMKNRFGVDPRQALRKA